MAAYQRHRSGPATTLAGAGTPGSREQGREGPHHSSHSARLEYVLEKLERQLSPHRQQVGRVTFEGLRGEVN